MGGASTVVHGVQWLWQSLGKLRGNEYMYMYIG